MKRNSLVFVSALSLALVALLAVSSPAAAQGRAGRGGPGAGPGAGAVSGPMMRDVIDRQALVAEVLGMTVDELQAAHDAGKTLLDLLAERGMSLEDFKSQLQTLVDAAIDDAVAQGLITPEQAEWWRSREARGGRGGGPGSGACEPGTGPREPIGPREPGAGRGPRRGG